MISELKNFFDFCTDENRKRFNISLALGVVIAICEALKFPAIGLILMGFFDYTINGGTVFLGFMILIISLTVNCIARGNSTMLQTIAGYGECAHKRIEIAEHLRFLPMGYFNKNSLGEITNVTTNIMEQLGDVATRVVLLTTQGILNTALIILMICIFDLRIGIICLAGIGIFACINYVMRQVNENLSQKKLETDAAVVESVLEYIQGISEVKSYNMTGSSKQKLNDAVKNAAKVNTKMEMQVNNYLPLQIIVLKLTGTAVLMASVTFFIQGSMSLVEAIVMGIVSFNIFSGLENTGSYSSLLHTVSLCVKRGREILEIPAMDIDGEDILPDSYDIDVKDIDFAYDKKKIIDNVTLNIPQRTTAAFVGPSGGGKTTLCHLIARFWDVKSGSISLDKRNVRDYSMDALMKNFSFVFQNVYLFHDTVANNIRFGRPEASMDEVVAAAKKASCHDFIEKLPDGYDTVIGENGASLSGGERQRISIARAIMKDAPVIILDEATANVDPENERELMDAINALTESKTILMIAHRLKTVQNADQIFVIDKGKIVQHGTHKELMAVKGIYSRFIDSRRQAIGWKL